jgi:hypothetical protein
MTYGYDSVEAFFGSQQGSVGVEALNLLTQLHETRPVSRDYISEEPCVAVYALNPF